MHLQESAHKYRPLRDNTNPDQIMFLYLFVEVPSILLNPTGSRFTSYGLEYSGVWLQVNMVNMIDQKDGGIYAINLLRSLGLQT